MNPFIKALNYYAVEPEELEAAANEIDCESGCVFAGYDPDTGHAECLKKEQDFCRSDVAEVLRSIAKAQREHDNG